MRSTEAGELAESRLKVHRYLILFLLERSSPRSVWRLHGIHLDGLYTYKLWVTFPRWINFHEPCANSINSIQKIWWNLVYLNSLPHSCFVEDKEGFAMTSDKVSIQENILLNRWRRLTRMVRYAHLVKIERPTLLDLVSIPQFHREYSLFLVEVVSACHHRLPQLRPSYHHYSENVTSFSLLLIVFLNHQPFLTTLPRHLFLVPAFLEPHLWIVLEAGTRLGLINVP